MQNNEGGTEPDYRFSLANERTFLAWIRTALAILAGAVLVHQFATRLEPRWVVLAASIGMAIAAAIFAGGAFFRWRTIQIAMRHAQPLPGSRLIAGAAVFSALLCVLAAFLLLRS